MSHSQSVSKNEVVPTVLAVRVLDGTSAQRELQLVAGQPLPPLTVGTQGAWRVGGARVAGLHVALAWSGRQLFACAVGSAPAALDGAPLDQRWRELRMSSELRFGSARLVVGTTRTADPDLGEPTVMFSDEATRIADVDDPAHVDPVAPTAPLEKPLRPAIDVPARSSLERTLLVAPQPLTQPLARPLSARAQKVTTLPLAASPKVTTLPLAASRRLFVQSPSPKATTLPFDAQRPGLRRIMPSAPERTAPPQPPAIEEAKESVATAPRTPTTDDLVNGLGRWTPSSPTIRCALPTSPPPEATEAPASVGLTCTPMPASIEHVAPESTFAVTGEHRVASSESKATPRGALRALVEKAKGLSGPRKASAVMMVPTLVLGIFVLRGGRQASIEDGQTTPTSRTTATSASASVPTAAPSASMAPAITTAAPSAIPSSPRPRPSTAPTTAAVSKPLSDGRTAERRALDTAASGSYASAAEQYEALAGAHPENAAFRQAARILRQRVSRLGT